MKQFIVEEVNNIPEFVNLLRCISLTSWKPFLHLNCSLTESPFWEEKKNILRFVDVVDQTVFRVSLDEGPTSVRKQKYQDSISVTADIKGNDDSFIFGGKYGVGIAKKDSAEMRYIKRFWSEEEEKEGKPEKMRANDGGADTKGRFWSSALCDPEVTAFAPEGILFRLDTDDQFHRVISNVTIPNGLSFSNDGRTLYFTDTADSCIYAYDYDEATGDISNKREFFRVAEEGAGPDGHAQDEEGNLWVAVWGAWKVVRVSPKGEVTAEIKLPTRCITAVGFAGEDVYITSEKEKEPEKYPESLKYQGNVFKCHVGIKGRRRYKASESYIGMNSV